MKRKASSARQQRGFTLVEMSVTMAAAGLMFAAVATGQELVDQAKATKLVNDVKAIESQIQQFAQFKGRMPGDCNNDGVIDYAADGNVATGADAQSVRSDIGNKARAEEYSYQGYQITIPADGDPAGAQTDACALVGKGTTTTNADVATSATNANVWLNDLKMAGVVSDSAPNRKLAKLVHEDFAFVGNVTDKGIGDVSAINAEYNAIVIHNVPQWMARRLAVAINGQDARADRSRLRQLKRTDSTDGTYEQRWQAVTSEQGPDTKATRDAHVTVVYFFDRIPETQTETLVASSGTGE